MPLKNKIKEINDNNIKKIEKYHRYHNHNHQNTETLNKLEFWSRTQNVIDEISNIDDYITYKVSYFLDKLKDNQSILNKYYKYKKNVVNYKNDITFKFEVLRKSYEDFANQWNISEIDNKHNSLYTKCRLNPNIYDIDLINKDICILHSKALCGKTHNLIHFYNYNKDNILIFFANFFNGTNIENSILNQFNIDQLTLNDIFCYLNENAKKNKRFFTIIIDGINEFKNFNKKDFWKEIENIYSTIKKYDHLHLLVSIRTEYLECNKNYSIEKLEQLDIESIFNLFNSLGIKDYSIVNYFYSETPVGFLYIISDVLERMEYSKIKNINNYSKTKFFEERIKQAEIYSDNINSNIITTSTKKVIKKILLRILNDETPVVNINDFSKDEKTIINTLVEEGILILNNYEDQIEFSYQFYGDYYVVDYIVNNWNLKNKRKYYKGLDFVIELAFSFLESPIFLINYFFTDKIKTMVKEVLKNIHLSNYYLYNILLRRKYMSIFDKVSLSETQQIILIENLRENNKIEFQKKKILKNNKLKSIWKKSIKYKYIDKNENIKNIINDFIDETNDFNLVNISEIKNIIDVSFPNNLYFINNYLLNMSLAKRDLILKNFIFDRYKDNILRYIQNMNSNKYINIFNEFSYHIKKNELYLLIWNLSSSNREIRDKSTILLSRILINDKKLYIDLWEEFQNINDLYILERMYLIGYIIIINKNSKYNECIAKTLYNFSYPDNKEAYRHIIIQEYGLRIYVWMLKNNIWQEPFHLKEYNISEITFSLNSDIDYESIVGKKCFYSLKLEREGIYGDFGRYEYEVNINRLLGEILKYYEDTNDINKKEHIKKLDLAFDGKRYILENIVLNYITLLDLGKKGFLNFDNSSINDRHDHRVERYTKKMQWIGMFQYMGWIRNYFNFIPPLIRPEYLIKHYNFSNTINDKLTEYANINNLSIEYSTYSYYYNIYNYINLDISNIRDNSFLKYFKEPDNDDIKSVKCNSELLKIYKDVFNKIKSPITKAEIDYIKNKLYKDGYVLVYGVESCSSETGCFGVKAEVFNEDICMDTHNKNFILPYSFGICSNEFFLIDSILENEYFVCEPAEKSEYDYSRIDNSINLVFNYKIMSKYNIKYSDGKYYSHNGKEVILNENNLWYIDSELMLKMFNDNLYIKWWGYYERRNDKENEEWDSDITYKNKQLICPFISRYNNNDFSITIDIN